MITEHTIDLDLDWLEHDNVKAIEFVQENHVVGIITAALVLGESVSLEQLIGGAVILAGLAIVSGVGLRTRKPSDAAAGS